MKKLLFSLVLLGAFAGNMHGVVFLEWAESFGGNGHLLSSISDAPEEALAGSGTQIEVQSNGGSVVSIESVADFSPQRNTFGWKDLFWGVPSGQGGSGSFEWAKGASVPYSRAESQSMDPNVTPVVVMNGPKSRGGAQKNYGVSNLKGKPSRMITEFMVENPSTVPTAGVPDTGNPLLLIVISLAAGMICRFLKR